MKHFFYGAKFLIIIYSLVAMLLSLGSMAYVKHLNDYKAFERLGMRVCLSTSFFQNMTFRLLIQTAAWSS